jgi:hypothetical protein
MSAAAGKLTTFADLQNHLADAISTAAISDLSKRVRPPPHLD